MKALKSLIGFILIVFALYGCGQANRPDDPVKVAVVGKAKVIVFTLPAGEKVISVAEDENARYLLTYDKKDSVYHYRTINAFSGTSPKFDIKETR